MSEEHKRQLGIFLYLGCWLLLGMVAVLLLMGLSPTGEWHGFALAKLRDYSLFGVSGALGGTIYAFRNLHRYFDQTGLRWMYWYFSRPWLCACTAVFLIILFDSGLLMIQLTDSLQGKMGLAFLAGYGYGKLMEKLTKLSRTLFDDSTTAAGTSGNFPPGSGTAARDAEAEKDTAATRIPVTGSNPAAAHTKDFASSSVPADPGPAPERMTGSSSSVAPPVTIRPNAANPVTLRQADTPGPPVDPGPPPPYRPNPSDASTGETN